jgi:DNA-directed DNA polymerase III PolC
MPVSLHTHSWFSLLEGLSSPQALLTRAAALGYRALALTDTANLYGAVAFVEQAFRHGIRPLLGACLRQQRTRCVALIADRTGYRSLCRIISRLNLQTDGPDNRPAALTDLLRDNAEGLHLLIDDPVLAEPLREPFERRLWLEIVRPHPRAAAGRREQDLLECGRRLHLRLVASTAVHAATPEEYPIYRLVSAIRQRLLLEQLPGQLPVTAEHSLVSPAELRRRFRDLPGAVAGGDALAELLRSDVLPRQRILPRPLSAGGGDPDDQLRAACERGLRRRDLGADLEARRRLTHELSILLPAGLAGYFLTVRDIARYARQRGHTMALRGSAGSSLVCYVLGITDVNPLRFGLSLDRFLHPGRTDLPDIDLDFDWKVRDEVIAHVVERYGQVHTAQISSHLFFQPRSAFREAGRIHGLSDVQIGDLLTMLSEKVDEVLLPAGGARPTPAPRLFPLEPERWPRLVADARLLLGRPHYLSIHPGGVVITPGPMEEHVPLQRAAKGVIITQLDKDGVEAVGLVKIDLLGNRALATVDEARQHVPAAQARRLCHKDAESDPDAIALLCRGDTLGICQLESPAMRHLLIQMQPQAIEDVIQSLALLRPGAAEVGMKETFLRRRHGLEPVRVAHPRLAPVLAETHGLLLYEDDALHALQALTGIPAADADKLRKRIAKCDDATEAGCLQAELADRCARQGIAPEVVTELWPHLAKFRLYSFCKSHAVSYGLIAWKAAYLKAHYPLPFWTAVLNNNQGTYPRRVYVEAIKRAGLEMRLPCVNHSAGPFTLEGQAIRTGLEAIAGLPTELRERVLDERHEGGAYRDLADFRRRVGPGPEALAVLIRAGALDWTGKPRPALFLEADLNDPQQRDMPELFPDHCEQGWVPREYSQARRWRDELEVLGFVLGPPLFRLFRPAAPPEGGPPLITSEQLPAHRGRLVRVWGLTATGRHVFGRDDRPVQFVTLEDEHGLTEVTLFAGSCPQTPYLTLGPYLATGVVEEQHGVYTVTARAFELVPGEG